MPKFCFDWEINCIHIPARYQSLVKFAVRIAVLNGSRHTSCSVSVHGVNVNKIQKLNKRYRQKDKPTNVLSFSSDAFEGDTDIDHRVHRELGDIYVCLQVVAREAKEMGIQFEHHLIHMIVHATLHLNGYDHEKEDEAHRMKSLEVMLLHRMNIPNPYQLH